MLVFKIYLAIGIVATIYYYFLFWVPFCQKLPLRERIQWGIEKMIRDKWHIIWVLLLWWLILYGANEFQHLWYHLKKSYLGQLKKLKPTICF